MGFSLASFKAKKVMVLVPPPNRVVGIVHDAKGAKDLDFFAKLFPAFPHQGLLDGFSFVDASSRRFEVFLIAEKIVPFDAMQGDLAPFVEHDPPRGETQGRKPAIGEFFVLEA